MAKTRAYSISEKDIPPPPKEGEATEIDISKIIKLDEVELRAVGPKDVKLKILAVSAEHNISHAATADTTNIAKARGGKIYPGNSAVGEIIEVGSAVDPKKFKLGDIVITHCNGEPDAYGFPLRIWAYDQPESIGWYSEEAVVGDWQIIKAPLARSKLSLWQIAALPLRAPTAYHLWRRALGMFRVKVSMEHRATLNVLSFGGGVGELFFQLAKAEGHNAFFCSGSYERRMALEAHGIKGIDQKKYNRFVAEDAKKRKALLKAFGDEIKEKTNGEGMHIVCDMLRGPVFEAGLTAAARGGVNVSSGWQISQVVSYNSTIQSVKQVTIDHMHYETIPGCEAATELYGRVFKPTIHKEIYSFEDLPRCMEEMRLNTQTGIPIIRVAKDMPENAKLFIW